MILLCNESGGLRNGFHERDRLFIHSVLWCVELFYVFTAAGTVLCKEFTDQEKLNCSFLGRF